MEYTVDKKTVESLGAKLDQLQQPTAWASRRPS